MLTRLEIHGFKNLLHFSLDFGAFNCIAGLNGVGKSNIFDAIHFISLLSEKEIIEAALDIRDPDSDGDPEDIFYTDGMHRVDTIIFAVEMIVPKIVVDDFGRSAEATSSYLRYEVEIGFRKSEKEHMRSSLYLKTEKLNYIKKGDAPKRLLFKHTVNNFRDSVIYNKRRSNEYITTSVADDGVTEIFLHTDRGTAGKPQKIRANMSPKTIVATINSTEFPTILAAKREMQFWRLLALEPSAMRRSNKLYEKDTITSNGDHLVATLHKLYEKDNNVFARITFKLNDILPAQEIKVDIDKARQLLTLQLKERAGAFLPARSLSDGTLRFLALCIMSEDPDFHGVICFEEPENGIHPSKMEAMYELLKELSVDTEEIVDDDNPMRQMIIATHSPAMVQLQEPADLIYADVIKIKGPFGRAATTLRCRPLDKTWRVNDNIESISLMSIVNYLTHQKGAKISLPFDDT